MKFKIPFSIFSIERAIKTSRWIHSGINYKKHSKLQEYLDNSDVGITREQYIAIIIQMFFLNLLFLSLISILILFFLNFPKFYIYGLFVGILFSGFLYFTQINYPRTYSRKREREIEKFLIPALQDMLVQLNSGIPLYSIMVNLSISNYGELSTEFEKAVRQINAGIPEIEVIDSLGKRNSSEFFKRVLWQISNGLRSGSDMSIVIRDSIDALTDEQMIQIQNYGNKLNPFIVFYMLISVIIPALAVTFLTIISSIVNLSQNIIIAIFLILFVFVVFVQVMFMGLIKSSRPALL